MKSINSFLSNCKYILRDAWIHNKLIYLWIIISSILTILLSLLGVILPSITMHGLEHHWGILAISGVVLILTILLSLFNFIKARSDVNYNTILETSRYRFINSLNRKIMTLNYSSIENAETQVKIDQVSDLLYTDAHRVGINGMWHSLKKVIETILGLIIYIIILKNLSIFIIFFIAIISFGSSWLMGKVDIYIHNNRDKWAVLDKKISYINSKLTRRDFAKDIRNYSCTNWLMGKLTSYIQQRSLWYKKIQKKLLMTEYYKTVLDMARYALIASYIVVMFIKKQISPAQFIFIWSSANQLSYFLGEALSAFTNLRAASLDISLIMEYVDGKEQSPIKKTVTLDNNSIKITFDNVYFKYSGSDDFIIKGFNTTISPGEKIALVGINGAGKTTLIKLLCGFYQPTEGNIYINDIPISKFSDNDITSLISAVYQDSIILPMTVAQNIALTSDEYIDFDLVHKCIEIAGLKDRFPDSNIPLIKAAQENATDLSGGELQKLFLARAIYKNAPILILDEPTAMLDPIAESEVYLKYNHLTYGKTSIFISHRLASTSFCDRIILVKDGMVYEEGSHEQLMNLKGEYYKLFKIQSKYYQNEFETISMESIG